MSYVSVEKRALAMGLDFTFMSIIGLLFFLPGFLAGIYHIFSDPDGTGPFALINTTPYFTIIGFVVFLMKDSLQGRSISKRMLDLQVVDNISGSPASPFQGMVRNLTIIIWPIEVIALLFDPNRRIGDKLASTQVIAYESTHEPVKHRWDKIILAASLPYALMIALTMPLLEKMDRLDEEWLADPDPIEGYNGPDPESRDEAVEGQLEQIIANKFPEYGSITIEYFAHGLGNDSWAYIHMGATVDCEFMLSERLVYQDTDQIKVLLLEQIPSSKMQGGINYTCFEDGCWSSKYARMSITTYPDDK